MPTHGSLTKAGKVRAQTPKVESASEPQKIIPRIKNYKNYMKRIVLSRGSRRR